jgi:hypothetical protein
MTSARQVAEKMRKEYLLIVALAAKSGNEGDLREACELTVAAIESAILAENEECAKVAEAYDWHRPAAFEIARNIRARHSRAGEPAPDTRPAPPAHQGDGE